MGDDSFFTSGFGASGFVARYVVNRLGRIGSKVIVPFRGDGLEVRHLKLMGDIVCHTTTPGLKVFQTVAIKKKDVKEVCVVTSP